MRWGRKWSNYWGQDTVEDVRITDLEQVPPTAAVEWLAQAGTDLVYTIFLDGKFYDTTTSTEVIVQVQDQGRHWAEIFISGPANLEEDLSDFATAVPGTRVKLSWTASADSDLDHYNIYWDSGDGSPLTLLGRTNLKEATWISDILVDGTYEFRVDPVDRAGNERTSASTVTVVISRYPDSPSGISLDTFDSGVATFSFTESTTVGVVGYKVYANGGSGEFVDYDTVLKTVPAPATSFTLNLSAGDWIVGIRAYNAGFEEDNVDVIAAFEIGGSPADLLEAQPNVPSALSAIPSTGGTMRLICNYDAFDELGAATQINYYADDGVSGVVNYSTAVAAATVPDHTASENAIFELEGMTAALTDGLTYTFAAKASTATGRESDSTDTVTGTADATAPADISGLTGEAVNYEE